MDITLKHIPVKDLVSSYTNDDEQGVIGYGGLLDIRPPYQREFVYNLKERQAVIQTVKKNYPLNIFYWAVRNIDTQDTNDKRELEIIDGQQRTLSLSEYINNQFSVDGFYFKNLNLDEKQQILNYELMVYVCEGSESKKLEWFKTINTSGVALNDQELRNAVYYGSWLTDAKRYFSRIGCEAFQKGEKYLKGTPNRQDYLETVIGWTGQGNIEAYMAQHQHDSNAGEIIHYFENVINWVNGTFPEYRREMKGLDWGYLYNQHKYSDFNADLLNAQVTELMIDDDVTKKRGIYEYLLSGNQKFLNIRSFTQADKRAMYERQNKICNECDEEYSIGDMEADHVLPWSAGGKTHISNGQMLCRSCNRQKSNR